MGELYELLKDKTNKEIRSYIEKTKREATFNLANGYYGLVKYDMENILKAEKLLNSRGTF